MEVSWIGFDDPEKYFGAGVLITGAIYPGVGFHTPFQWVRLFTCIRIPWDLGGMV